MIIFEHHDGTLKKAVFSGSLAEMCADLCLELSLIYGSVAHTNKKAAEQFKNMFLLSLIDPNMNEQIFSSDLYNGIANAGDHVVGSVTVDEEELARQLAQLLGKDDDE